MGSERPSQEGKLSPGAPNDPVPFGRYFLHGLIARGGMAEVYRARHQVGPRRMLAIKVMRPQLAREPRFVDMFHREGKLAMLLQNRCIVETIELGQHDGRHFITMEYIGGRDLTQVLRRCQETQQRIPVPHAVYIAARIAEGLHFAHTLTDTDGRPLNIVNRDVSPSNVRLSYDGDVKLLDFGIAQALMKFTSEIGILKGKFSYMSPEQIRGMPLDARTDVFSAGIILHEMLTTEKLFRGDTEFALMEKVRKAEVPAPSDFNRRVSPELDAISLKALSRDVADRYQTAAQLAAALDALIGSYRFDPKELRQFIRQLFRKEYAKEVEDTQLSLETSPGEPSMGMSTSSRGQSTPPSDPASASPDVPVSSDVAPGADTPVTESQGSSEEPAPRDPSARGNPRGNPVPTTVTTAASPPPERATRPAKPTKPKPAGNGAPRGFWGALFKKRK
jgi:serine/threonine protein kinase